VHSREITGLFASTTDHTPIVDSGILEIPYSTGGGTQAPLTGLKHKKEKGGRSSSAGGGCRTCISDRPQAHDRTFLVWPLLATNVPYSNSDTVHGGSEPGILSVYMSCNQRVIKIEDLVAVRKRQCLQTASKTCDTYEHWAS
jgi:hypothetical protein